MTFAARFDHKAPLRRSELAPIQGWLVHGLLRRNRDRCGFGSLLKSGEV
jgi:hypothetical protein